MRIACFMALRMTGSPERDTSRLTKPPILLLASRPTLAAEIQDDPYQLPPLDLLIRTSGEVRLSNFLLWQAAYAELWFTDVLWPDFKPEHLQEALDAFAGRERRYGGR